MATARDATNQLPIPPGHRVLLPGRGTTFVRESAGPPGAPTLVLVHGWMASGGLNWIPAFEPLSEHFRVLAPDNRGHGRGISTGRRFRIADVADDIAALLDVLGIERAIFAGYSLGGPISQLMWHRHRDRVEGLIFAATGFDLVQHGGARMAMSGATAVLAAALRAGGVPGWIPSTLARSLTDGVRGAQRPQTLTKWARAEMQRHSWRMISEAGLAIGSYSSSDWIGTIDVPTEVIVTQRDRAVPPEAQYALAAAIPGARIHRFDGGHVACVEPAFGSILTEAARSAAERAGMFAPGAEVIPLPTTTGPRRAAR